MTKPDGSIVEMPSKGAAAVVHKGDRVLIRCAGSGGYGDPLEREADRVLKDVIDGYITATRDGLDSSPVFWSATINPPSNPLLSAPGQEAHDDFIGTDIGPDGSDWGEKYLEDFYLKMKTKYPDKIAVGGAWPGATSGNLSGGVVIASISLPRDLARDHNPEVVAPR